MGKTRVALVTGGAKGIGRAMTLGLLADGIDVAVAARDADSLRSLVAEARTSFPDRDVLPIVTDLSFAEECLRTAASVIDHYDRLDILVNNAGIGTFEIRKNALVKPVLFWEVGLENWRRFMDINISAAFALTSAIAPQMVERGHGRIISITTSLGSMLGRGLAAYGASKAALEALTAVMGADLEGTGVTANVITPGGYVDTSMIPDETGLDRSKMLRAEIMVPPLLWIVSDAASNVSRRRIVAAEWDATLEPDLAGQRAARPIAWLELATTPIKPAKRSE
jgi:NAD(P)-dependent dehydrogenase (short-subunit alcohol dehydrogenase family)